MQEPKIYPITLLVGFEDVTAAELHEDSEEGYARLDEDAVKHATEWMRTNFRALPFSFEVDYVDVTEEDIAVVVVANRERIYDL